MTTCRCTILVREFIFAIKFIPKILSRLIKPCVAQILRDSSSQIYRIYHELNKFYLRLRTSPSYLANVCHSLCFIFHFILFQIILFFSLHKQGEHLQFTADSTCTEGEIPEVQFDRLNTFHLVADGLQHLQNSLKNGGWSSGSMCDAQVPTQAFTRTYRDSQPVLVTCSLPISGLQKTPNLLNGLLDWLEWIRTKSRAQEQNEDNLDMIRPENRENWLLT